MLETHMLNPNGYKNSAEGFAFQMRVPYYRGFSLSIIRNIQVCVDGVEYPREDVAITVNGETFTLEEARTVVSNRWVFGRFGEVSVKKEGGLSAGEHDIQVTVTIAPSYMPMQLVKTGHAKFTV